MSAVKSDCPVARERLIPYLSGKLDGTPEGEEFEAHVSNCPICKVVASDRRKTLQALIAALDPAMDNKPIGNEHKQTKDKSAKLLLLASVCALLLIVMSYVSGPVSAILGDKVATGEPSGTPSLKDNPPISQPTTAHEKAPLHEDSKKTIATVSSTDSPGKQIEAKKSKKAENVSKAKTSDEIFVPSSNSLSSKKKRSKTSQYSPPMNRIEIFDESGKKIGVAITPQGR